MLPSASQLQKSSWPVWFPWELQATDLFIHLFLMYIERAREREREREKDLELLWSKYFYCYLFYKCPDFILLILWYYLLSCTALSLHCRFINFLNLRTYKEILLIIYSSLFSYSILFYLSVIRCYSILFSENSVLRINVNTRHRLVSH